MPGMASRPHSPASAPLSALLERALGLIAFTVLMLLGAPLPAQTAATPEYQVEAVFLFNFTQFVEWPPDAFTDSKSPIVIGLLGEDPFGTYLDEAVRGEKIDGRALVVRRFRRLEDVLVCHVLFISQSEAADLDRILSELKGRALLTVSNLESFSRRGGIVRFVNENNRVRLRVNVEAAKAARLTISSKLLRVAEIVATETVQ